MGNYQNPNEKQNQNNQGRPGEKPESDRPGKEFRQPPTEGQQPGKQNQQQNR